MQQQGAYHFLLDMSGGDRGQAMDAWLRANRDQKVHDDFSKAAADSGIELCWEQLIPIFAILDVTGDETGLGACIECPQSCTESCPRAQESAPHEISCTCNGCIDGAIKRISAFNIEYYKNKNEAKGIKPR